MQISADHRRAVKLTLTVLFVACGSNEQQTAANQVPRDGRVHRFETAAPGGTRLQLIGFDVPLETVKLPEWVIVPISGKVDVAVDLHIPSDGDARDYRGATGNAEVHCRSACTLEVDRAFGDSGSNAPAISLPRIVIDRFEARAVFAGGTAQITTWSLESKDVRIEATGQLRLARALLESEATACVRFTSKSSSQASNSRIAPLLADAGIALDANGLWNLKLAGRLDSLAPADFGCDGATPPSSRTAAPDAAPAVKGIKQLDDASYEISRAQFDELLQNPMETANGARLVPAMKNGKPEGFKLYAIRPSSVFALLGFTNGDTLRSVNGVVLDSAERGLEVFTSLRKVSSVNVEITRAGKPMTLAYRITD